MNKLRSAHQHQILLARSDKWENLIDPMRSHTSLLERALWRSNDWRLLSEAPVLLVALALDLDTEAREFSDLEGAVCAGGLIGCYTFLEIVKGVLTRSLEAFSITAAFFISSSKEEPNKRLSAGITFAVDLAKVLKAGLMSALLDRERR